MNNRFVDARGARRFEGVGFESLQRSAAVVVAVLALASAALPVAVSPQSNAGPHGHSVMKDLMVPMRDGVQLATDLYLPARGGRGVEGKWPTVLVRTPYGREAVGAAFADRSNVEVAEYFATHGYAVILQDTRGRYGSEGTWSMLYDDGRDGYDAVEWIAEQPWSDGQVGMIGTSYLGGTQHAVAMEKAPHLTTIIPVDAVANAGYWGMRNGGAFELRFWNWIHLAGPAGSPRAHAPGVAAALGSLAEQRISYLNHLPLRYGTTPLKLLPAYERWLIEAMREGAVTDFWETNNIRDHPERFKDIPTYLVSGWYDSWARATTMAYEDLADRITGPVYMIMGPWIHGFQDRSAHGQVSFGDEAAIPDVLEWRREWLDHWMKGADNAVGVRDPFSTPVRIFVMGTGDGSADGAGNLDHGGYWRNEHEWPLARAEKRSYYLHADGRLSPEAPGEARSATPFEFDPTDPVPTIGGNISSGGGILLQGAWDQRCGDHQWNCSDPIELSARSDVVVFETEPLADDLEVTGEVTVHLWASSTAVDTDFTAKLIDVYPPSSHFAEGFDLLLGDGIIRARFRDSLKEERLMEPGEVYSFTIRLNPTSNVFKRGHRIRLDVSSSNFPRFDVNPNTGEPLNRHRRVVTAVNTVFHDAERRSHVVLPVIPR